MAEAVLCSQQLLQVDDGLRSAQLHSNLPDIGGDASLGSSANQGGAGVNSGGLHAVAASPRHGAVSWLAEAVQASAVDSTHARVQRSAASRSGRRVGVLSRATSTQSGRHGVKQLAHQAKVWVGSKASQLDSWLPIVHPKAAPKVIWDVLIMALVIYVAVTIPLDISFGMPLPAQTLNYLDWAIDCVFLVDMCINFRTAFWDGQGHLVQDSRLIAVSYLRFWFPIDLLATIPWDLLAMAFGLDGQGGTTAIVLAFLKTPRLLRLGRLLRLLDHVRHVQSFKVVLLVLSMAAISHWLACAWYCMFKFSSFAPSPSDWSFDVYHNGSVLSYWLSAYYQCFLLLMGNAQVPLNNAERVFFIVCGVCGTCFYAAVVGQMALLVASLNIVSIRHKQRQDLVTQALRYSGAPQPTLMEVEQYFTCVTQYNHPMSEGAAAFHDLPPALCQDLSGALYEPWLRKLPLLAGVDPRYVARLALKTRVCVVPPKQVLYRCGDPVSELLVVFRGSVAVLQSLGQMTAILQPGDSWGGTEAVSKVMSAHQVVALRFSDLLVLSAADMWAVMRDFPHCAARLKHNALEALQADQERYCVYMDEAEDLDREDGAAEGAAPGAEGGSAKGSKWAAPGPGAEAGALAAAGRTASGAPAEGRRAMGLALGRGRGEGGAVTDHADLLDLGQGRQSMEEGSNSREIRAGGAPLVPADWLAAGGMLDAVIHVAVDRPCPVGKEVAEQGQGLGFRAPLPAPLSTRMTSQGSLGAALDALRQPGPWSLPPYVGDDASGCGEMTPAQARRNTLAGTPLRAMPGAAAVVVPPAVLPAPPPLAAAVPPVVPPASSPEAPSALSPVAATQPSSSSEATAARQLPAVTAVSLAVQVSTAMTPGAEPDGCGGSACFDPVVGAVYRASLDSVCSSDRLDAVLTRLKAAVQSRVVAGAALDHLDQAGAPAPSLPEQVGAPALPLPLKPPDDAQLPENNQCDVAGSVAQTLRSDDGSVGSSGTGTHSAEAGASGGQGPGLQAAAPILQASSPDAAVSGSAPELDQSSSLRLMSPPLTLQQSAQEPQDQWRGSSSGRLVVVSRPLGEGVEDVGQGEAAGGQALVPPAANSHGREGLQRWLSDQGRITKAALPEQVVDTGVDGAAAGPAVVSPFALHWRKLEMPEAQEGAAARRAPQAAAVCHPSESASANALRQQQGGDGEEMLQGLSQWLSQPTAKLIRHRRRRSSADQGVGLGLGVAGAAGGANHRLGLGSSRRSSQADGVEEGTPPVQAQDQSGGGVALRWCGPSRHGSLVVRLGSAHAARASAPTSRPPSAHPLTHRSSEAVAGGGWRGGRRSSANLSCELLSRPATPYTSAPQPSERERWLEAENEELRSKLASARKAGQGMHAQLLALASLVDAMAVKMEGLEADLQATDLQVMQLEDSVGVGISLLGVAAAADAHSLHPHTTHPLGLRSASRVIARERRPLTATQSAQRGSASWSGSHHLPGLDPSTCPKSPPRRGCSIDHSTSLAPHVTHGLTMSRLRAAPAPPCLEGWQDSSGSLRPAHPAANVGASDSSQAAGAGQRTRGARPEAPSLLTPLQARLVHIPSDGSSRSPFFRPSLTSDASTRMRGSPSPHLGNQCSSSLTSVVGSGHLPGSQPLPKRPSLLAHRPWPDTGELT